MTAPLDPPPTDAPELTVRTHDRRTYRFTKPFVIGRDRGCDVRIDDGRVSRQHVRVSFERGEWRLEDLESGNGVYIGDRRVETAPIKPAVAIRLGPDGPAIELEAELAAGETIVLAGYMERYFKGTETNRPVGKDTVMIRRAFQRVQQKQRRAYSAIIGVVAAIAVAAAGYAYYSHNRLMQLQAAAEDVFYQMKAMDVVLASQSQEDPKKDPKEEQERIRRFREQRRAFEASYERYLTTLSGGRATPEEQAILRVARLFGECDVAAPPDYVAEVRRYIREWQRTSRFAKAVSRAQQRGYIPRIVDEFQRQNLPAQFFYLAMQESDFVEDATGPATRFGYAKGMWMFIPDTGRRYGLKIGPLERFQRSDPADDRHNWEKSTRAAAAYIREIYSTDAQASGLLVMASYNWGERRVVELIKTLPANPRERNFWRLLLQHRQRMPAETYDYVFRIVSAAVIGENPRLFGFDFDNPLATAASPVARADY